MQQVLTMTAEPHPLVMSVQAQKADWAPLCPNIRIPLGPTLPSVSNRFLKSARELELYRAKLTEMPKYRSPLYYSTCTYETEWNITQHFG